MLDLRLGVAKIDITPLRPLPLAGFARRQGHFEGISHPLYARVFFFEQAEASGRRRRALVVSADLIWWGPERMPGLLRRLRERWGFEEPAVILHATHTHSGPQTSSRFVSLLGSPDQDYLELMEARLLPAIERAAENVEVVTVERGRGACHIGINRCTLIDGKIVGTPNPDGPVDPEVNVVRFQTQSGRTKALLVHYTCHPTTTDARFVSAEFPGVAMQQVEQELGDGVVAAYLQGCCGDIRPALVREGAFYYGDREVRALGSTLAKEILAILQRPMQVLPARPLAGRAATVLLPFQALPTIAELEAKRQQPGIAGAWSRLLLADAGRIQPTIPLKLVALDLADGLSLLAMDGEVTVEYGLFVKAHSGGRVLPMGYSNGMIGYVPTARQVAEGGYEAAGSCPYFGLPAPFAPALEERVYQAMIDLIEEDRHE